MCNLHDIGHQVAEQRRARGLTQTSLAALAGLSRATIDALENGRGRDIGVSRLTRILSVLGLEFVVRPSTRTRPTLDDLLQEPADD